MEHIKKRLVFYFYTFDGFKENRAIKIHLKCLKHYSHVFDEALFIISVDDTENAQLIYDTEVEILGAGFKDVRFKVHKNNGYCEAQPFFEEIMEKLDTLDGLTFFGHTKGVTNYQKAGCCVESIDDWLIGMYYLNLEHIEDVENKMTYRVSRFYGAFLTDNEDGPGVNCLYSGTFYWMNCPMIDIDRRNGEADIPKTYHQRGFAETLPGLLYKWKGVGTVEFASYCTRCLYPYDPYFETNYVISFLLGDDIGAYSLFKNEVLNSIQ